MLTSFFEKMIAPELDEKQGDSQISKILKGVIEKYNQQLACTHCYSIQQSSVDEKLNTSTRFFRCCYHHHTYDKKNIFTIMILNLHSVLHRQCVFEPLNRLDGKMETVVCRLLDPQSCPRRILASFREDVSQSGSFSAGPYPMNLLSFPGLWVGGMVRATSHTCWEKIMKATEQSLNLTRLHCLQVHKQSGKTISVTEATNFCKRNLARYLRSVVILHSYTHHAMPVHLANFSRMNWNNF